MANGKTICTVCNYIFDVAPEEPRHEIKAGCKFEELSDEWVCLECGSAKKHVSALHVCESPFKRAHMRLKGRHSHHLNIGFVV